MWPEIQELNDALSACGDSPWWYSGDETSYNGGIAVRVDRMFGFAEVVELTSLFSATNDADGLVLLEKGTVLLERLSLRDRNNLRSAMESVDITMTGLIADYPGDDRWKVMAELARAKWIYGQRDISQELILCFDPDAAEDNDTSVWTVDETVEGEEGVKAAFLDMLN